MLWKDFKDSVTKLLVTDGSRLGIGVENLRSELIAAAARDIQFYVRRYQSGNETRYKSTDFTTDGKASYVDLPSNATVRDAVYERVEEGIDPATATDIVVFPLDLSYPWADRGQLIGGTVNLPSETALGSISPDLSRLYVFPEVTAGEVLDTDAGTAYDHSVKITWDGVADTWNDTDNTPFDNSVALVAMWYVKGYMTINRSEKEGAAFLTAYRRERLQLYLKQQANG